MKTIPELLKDLNVTKLVVLMKSLIEFSKTSPSFHRYLPAIHQLRRTAKRLDVCKHSTSLQSKH
ncbi:hypothetical protein DPMN_124107 [Dreissena polymorpha]|uniref:Uncharacterized protein n=1 Tax=Dreissena polymorpha TaxID=45954 RepID=A0A9D4GVH9_DREPO|nr:hypothetical protein DPMN_124107 [Dreissena polymorpha]